MDLFWNDPIGGGGVPILNGMAQFVPVYFIILLCLKPDDFTHQDESTGAHFVK